MEPFSYILLSSTVKIDGECHCNIPLCLSFIVEKLCVLFSGEDFIWGVEDKVSRCLSKFYFL